MALPLWTLGPLRVTLPQAPTSRAHPPATAWGCPGNCRCCRKRRAADPPPRPSPSSPPPWNLQGQRRPLSQRRLPGPPAPVRSRPRPRRRWPRMRVRPLSRACANSQGIGWAQGPGDGGAAQRCGTSRRPPPSPLRAKRFRRARLLLALEANARRAATSAAWVEAVSDTTRAAGATTAKRDA